MPESPFLRNAEQSAPSETEGEKQFLKPRAPSISGVVNGAAGKVSSKPSVSDIPEVASSNNDTAGDFDEDDILTQYGSQKPADENDATVLAVPSDVKADGAETKSETTTTGATNGDFDTFEDFTACEEAAAAAAKVPGSSHPEDIPSDTTKTTASDDATKSTTTSATEVKADIPTTSERTSAPSNATTTTTTVSEESESQLETQDSMVYEVFKNLRIAMLGFNEEEVKELSELIEGSLGAVVTSTPTTLNGPEADYLIVPIQVRNSIVPSERCVLYMSLYDLYEFSILYMSSQYFGWACV